MIILYIILQKQMNIIQEQIESIVRDNNTAQKKLINLLDVTSKSIHELRFQEPLHGELDLSVFENMGFMRIKELYLAKGEITHITNFPKNLEILSCNDNYLTEITGLPTTIVNIDLQYNYLKRVDFKELKNLKVLNISHNQFEEVDNLPSHLEELYCENNQIKNIDLKDIQQIRILHALHNPMSIVENVPPSLLDLQMDNNSFNEITYTELKQKQDVENPETKISYLESLNEYFKLKQKYETELHTQRKKTYLDALDNDPNPYKKNIKKGKRDAQKIKPKCINCKRPVGTIFSHTDSTYTAICGNADPQTKCPLNIKISNGKNFNLEDLLYESRIAVEERKQDIITQKMNTLFSYVPEKQSVALFKKELEEYTTYSNSYKKFLDRYNNLHNDPLQKELVQKKQEEVYKLIEIFRGLLSEYTKTGNREILTNAIEIHIKELTTEIESLGRLKFESREIKNTFKLVRKNVIWDKSILIQHDVSLSKLDINLGAEPKVDKFVKNV